MEPPNLSNLKDVVDSKGAISASALFWAISSLVVITFKPLGFFSSYVDALPLVIVISWLAAEITTRVPKRIHIAHCEKCGWRKLQDYPFQWLWLSRWGRCVKCGSILRLRCFNGHLFSVFTGEALPDKNTDPINCSKCGYTISKITPNQYYKLIYEVARKAEDVEGIVEEFSVLSQLKIIISKTKFDLFLVESLDNAILQLEPKYERSRFPRKELIGYSREDHDKLIREAAEKEEIQRKKAEENQKAEEEVKVKREKDEREREENLYARVAGLTVKELRRRVEEEKYRSMFGYVPTDKGA